MEMQVSINPAACILWALLVLTVPLNWLFAAVFAACFHELCHYLAVRITGGRVFSLQMDIGGAIMLTEPLSCGKEFFHSLAGPAGSFLLLLGFRWFPRIAICAALQGAFNLLPLYPLDGGRALRCFADSVLSESSADLFQKWVQNTILFGILLAAAVLSFQFSLGILPLIFACLLLWRVFSRKIPCKEGNLGVQ